MLIIIIINARKSFVFPQETAFAHKATFHCFQEQPQSFLGELKSFVRERKCFVKERKVYWGNAILLVLQANAEALKYNFLSPISIFFPSPCSLRGFRNE